jgi:hypothetical protein
VWGTREHSLVPTVSIDAMESLSGPPAKPLVVDRASIFRHHIHGQSLKDISRIFHISRTSVARIIRAEKKALPKGGVQMRLEELENTTSQNAA